MSGVSLQIISRAAQTFGIVFESTKTVVAGCAQEATNAAALVAMIDGKTILSPLSNHCFWLKADRTFPILDFIHCFIGRGWDAMRSTQITFSHKERPCLWRKTIAPFSVISSSLVFQFIKRRPPMVQDEIVNSIIMGACHSGAEILGRLSALDKRPDYMMQRHPAALSDADISMKYFGAALNWVPVSGNIAGLHAGPTRRIAPTERKWLGWIVGKQMADRFYINTHCQSITETAKGGK